ncbi:MAG TPA: TetR family transcriptional regulator [Phenylobacterium sp.]|nr:TetR family transcriptional regulator [Phenylobacterium sp.]
MTAVGLAVARRRNAEATRQDILDAARCRFACEGYDRAGLREIAADAGVDAALISRYFGGKDELFSAVLASTTNAEELFHGAPEDFAARMARMMVREPQSDTKLDCILIMLRSASSERAAEANRKFGDTHFFEPMAAWIGGADGEVLARLLGALMMGMGVSRAINPDFSLSAAELDQLEARLREMILHTLTARRPDPRA